MTSAPYAVVSLRLPANAPFVAPTAPPNSRAAWAARSVTIVRIPIAGLGLIALLRHASVIAIAAFAVFAIVDVFDGIAARKVGCDTAARRTGDVVLDRFAIHAAALAACYVAGVGWAAWLCLLSRDLIQATMSVRLSRRTRTVIIGAHWHMSYGLSMLVWGSTFIALGYPPLWLTILTGMISVITFYDYARRCAEIERRFLSPALNQRQ